MYVIKQISSSLKINAGTSIRLRAVLHGRSVKKLVEIIDESWQQAGTVG
jgi:hypothetical protein